MFKYKIKNLKFGKLLAKENGNSQDNKILCICDCGRNTYVRIYSLISNHTKSCGCSSKGHFRKHNKSKSRIYRIWTCMFTRCYNSKCLGYKNYGGKGIIISESWHKFENFLADMGEPPDKMSIDRIDNNGNYCKENCRWATNGEQARNRSDNHWITAWAKRLGMNGNAISKRINRGMSPELAVTTPKKR